MLSLLLLISLPPSLTSLTLPSDNFYTNNDYVDIDGGALVKVEFSKTLSGMMNAMEEIQSRADNIMENIMMKEAEEERLSLEHHSNQMLDEKQKIEENIKYLVK